MLISLSLVYIVLQSEQVCFNWVKDSVLDMSDRVMVGVNMDREHVIPHLKTHIHI